MSNLSNKHIILGITGGIAAYKSAEFARRLCEQGADVRVVMTGHAMEFITPLTMQAVSCNPVYTDLFDPNAEAAMGHIALARWADMIVIAPASANFIAQLTYGHANNLLNTLCLASAAPIILAPAMNQQMWKATVTQGNLQVLVQRGIKILGPAEGVQACGDVGFGRMLEPEDLVTEIAKLFETKALAGTHILITAGPTQEAIDPVRFLSNHSSGKMGYALAEAAVAAGAKVTLISGPVALPPPANVQGISIDTAQAMYDAVMQVIHEVDIFIAAAAVSDYRCVNPAQEKIKKTQAEITLKLIRNPDILADVAKLSKRPFVIGFAAETENLLEHAHKKLREKKLDLLIANQVGTPDMGFGSDNNSCTVIWDKSEQFFPLVSKKQLARQLITLIEKHYHAKSSNKHS